MGQVTTERFFQFRVLAYVDITQGYMNKKYDILTSFFGLRFGWKCITGWYCENSLEEFD